MSRKRRILDKDNMEIRKLRKFIRDTCCNHHDVDRCWPEPDGIVTCRYWREFQDGKLPRCKWLEEAVLPNDVELEAEYWDEIGVIGFDKNNVAKCKRCKKSFVKKTNNQIVCPKCRPLHNRELMAKASREYRARKRSKTS